MFSKTSICLLWHLPTFWGSFGSERRVIKEITSLDLFTCPYQVFMNNYPGGCIPQLDAGSLIRIRSHLEIHDYIGPKKEFVGDNAWLKIGLWRSILFHSEDWFGSIQNEMYVTAMHLVAESQSGLALKIAFGNFSAMGSMNLRWLRLHNPMHRDDIHVIVYLATNPKMNDI